MCRSYGRNRGPSIFPSCRYAAPASHADKIHSQSVADSIPGDRRSVEPGGIDHPADDVDPMSSKVLFGKLVEDLFGLWKATALLL